MFQPCLQFEIGAILGDLFACPVPVRQQRLVGDPDARFVAAFLGIGDEHPGLRRQEYLDQLALGAVLREAADRHGPGRGLARRARCHRNQRAQHARQRCLHLR